MSQLMARYCLTGSRTAIFPRGLRPRLRTLRLVQPYRLVFNYTRTWVTELYGKSGFSRKSNRPTVIMPLSLLSTERCSPPLSFTSFFWQYCHFFDTKFKILIQSGDFYVVFLAILPLFRHRDYEERLLLKHTARRQPHTHTTHRPSWSIHATRPKPPSAKEDEDSGETWFSQQKIFGI